MKKIISLFLVLALCVALCACGGDNSADNSTTDNGSTTGIGSITDTTGNNTGTTEHTHDYQETDRVESTDTEDGFVTYSCAICGDSYTEVLQATGPAASIGLEYEHNGDGTCTVIGIGTCTDYEIVIPSEFEGSKVTAIGMDAFSGCTQYGVTIPNTVISIGARAFRGSHLNSVTIPDSVTSIGMDAFNGCNSLKSVSIGNGVTSIGSYAFYDCENLQYNEFDNAYYLGNDTNPYMVFIDVKSTDITTICVHEDTIIIYPSAFAGCENLENISIPNGVINVDFYAFNQCDALQYNEFDNAFYLGNDDNPYVVLVKAKTTDITSIRIHDNTRIIYDSAFRSCKLTNVTIPDNVVSIGSNAFEWCSDMTDVTFGKNVTSIGSSAFKYTGLTSITIPTSVTSVGGDAFNGCSHLTSVVISNGTTSIGTYAFAYCKSLTSVTLPESISVIRKGTFAGCTSLTNIVIPDSVTKLENAGNTSWGGAFSGCTSLTSINLPAGIIYIGVETFMNCSNLTSIEFAGTQEQWEEIVKDSRWDELTGTYTVYCTDGEITK